MKHSTVYLSRNKEKRKKHTLLVVCFWLVLWQLASMVIQEDLLFAGPLSVLHALLLLMQEVDFYFSILHSLLKIMGGFFLGAALGILLAVLSFRLPLLEEILAPFVSLMKSIPIASFVVLVLIWMSSASLSIFISFFVVFPSIYIGTLEGLKDADEQLLEMAFVFRMRPLKKALYIYVPGMFPLFLSACKVSAGMCWKAGIAAEIIGTPKYSIGEQLYMAKIYLSTANLFAWTLIIILLSMLCEKLLLWGLSMWKKRLEDF